MSSTITLALNSPETRTPTKPNSPKHPPPQDIPNANQRCSAATARPTPPTNTQNQVPESPSPN
ncbi:hypothetical protein ACPTIC_30390, partial [Pseudomonas aeruginosa]|uniref:hypothetical protein n=1 Tax=Pseudomonas aeruginosa TaxID=287 RepID=UPI003CC6334B